MSELKTAPYITVHGPDGSGKTSIGRRIVALLGEYGRQAVFFDDWRDSTEWDNPFSGKHIRESIGNRKDAFIALQLAKVAMDSAAISNLTDSGIVVVKDRGLLDVRADLSYRGMDPTDCRGPLVREPDFAIYLQVGEEARQRRLAVKEDVHPEDYQPNTPGHRMYAMTQFVESTVSQMAPDRGVIIPTDELSIKQVAEKAYTVVAEILC